MFLVLFFVFLSFTDSFIIRWFPYKQFFNIPQEKVDTFSKYICARKQTEEKCCRCKDGEANMGETCIDYKWVPYWHIHLNPYLKETYLRKKLTHEDDETTCQPILSHVPATSGHLVEHVSAYSYRYNQTNITDCIDYEKIHLKKEFNFMIFSVLAGFVYNKKCITVLDIEVHVKRYIPIKVYCRKTSKLTSDMVFSVKSLDLLEKCIFVVDFFNDTALEKETNFSICNHHKNFCEKKNEFHDLCQTYTAPIGGYRNIHCALCDNQTWDHYEKVEQCTGCPEGVCDLRKRVNGITYPISFSLIPDEDGTEYRVKNITSAFPIAEFFGIESDDAHQFKPFLCSEGKSVCCNCDQDCMKYHSCCVDAMWNTKSPLKTKEYKQLFALIASKYKSQDCVHLIPLVKDNSKMYKMITKCASRSTLKQESVNKCLYPVTSMISSIIPVIGTDGYLYRNKYCAFCNDIHTYTPINLTCLFLFADNFDMKNCTFEIDTSKNQIKTNIVKECFRNFGNGIDCDTENVNRSSCDVYGGSIGTHKNYHCYVCKNQSNRIPVIQKCNRRNHFLLRGVKTSITFQIDTHRVSSITPLKEHMCNETENILELFGDGCRQRKIQLLTDHEFDRCLETKGDISLFAKLNVKNETRSNPTWMEFLNSSFEYTIQVYINDPHRIIYRVLGKRPTMTKEFISHYVDNFKISLKIEEVKHFFLFLLKEPLIREEFDLDVGRVFPNKRICLKMRVLERSKVSFTNSCQIIYESINLYNSSEVSLWIRFDRFGISRFIAVCELFYVSEKLLWIRRITEYTVIVSLTGNCLNLIFYVKIIHVLFPMESCRRHLVLTLNLLLLEASSLFSTVLKNLVSVDEYLLCQVIAVVHHFAFLMVQVWCVMCCFNVWSILRTDPVHFNRFRSNVKQSLFITLLILLIGFFMDYSGYVSLGYYNTDMCLPNAFFAELCFYIIPMVVSIVSSICILCRFIVFLLMEKSDENSNDSAKESLQLIYLSFKIVLIVELVEIIGFVREYDNQRSKESLLFPIFGLINGLIKAIRGAVMCFVFFNTKQRINKIKNTQRFACSKTLSNTQDSTLNEELYM